MCRYVSSVVQKASSLLSHFFRSWTSMICHRCTNFFFFFSGLSIILSRMCGHSGRQGHLNFKPHKAHRKHIEKFSAKKLCAAMCLLWLEKLIELINSLVQMS